MIDSQHLGGRVLDTQGTRQWRSLRLSVVLDVVLTHQEVTNHKQQQWECPVW